jgi:hypothetical protein
MICRIEFRFCFQCLLGTVLPVQVAMPPGLTRLAV